jgi:viologen exporter family transport system permease protein
MARYARLYWAFVRTGLMQELAFRGNFLIRVGTELLWFALLCLFYEVIYQKTNSIAGWNQYEYLVLVGTHFIATGLVETFFMPNFTELAEKVRSGKLDFALAKPVDEQFLLTTQSLDWATFTNVAYGIGMICFSLARLDAVPTVGQCAVYIVTLLSGVAIFYSLMTMLAVTAVWLIRNQQLYEMWFYVNIFARFPPEIFEGPLGSPLRWLTTFVIPVLVAVAVPAATLARGLSQFWMIAYSISAALVLLGLSRWVFRWGLKYYRSASS